MAHVKHTLTRDDYDSIAAADTTVNVQLPIPPYRTNKADKVELILAATKPTKPAADETPNELATILENTRYQFTTVTQLTVPNGEQLWARWLGVNKNAAAADLYVVVF